MNYDETIDFLYHQLPVFQREGKSAYKANLNNTHALDEHFGFPHKSFKTIHVAGTNGKGSVSHMLSSILQHAGYNVGLYTSPHLLDMRERIKVNGLMCSKQFVVDFVAENRTIIDRIKPSFFELMVLMAFRYFEKQKVDIAVVEVGMGGRLDSTNIITPLLSVITNIGLDHTQFLGNSLQQIAGEKGGIIKPEIPVVVGEKDVRTAPVFQNLANTLGSEITFADEQYLWRKSTPTQSGQEIKYLKNGVLEPYTIDLMGSYQKRNLATVLASTDVLKNELNISNDNIHSGLSNIVASTGLLGRWQILSESPKIICDTGHNKEGLEFVIDQLKAVKSTKIHLVLGLVNEKNPIEILSLFPPDSRFYLTEADIPRAMKISFLTEAATQLGLNFTREKNVQNAIENARFNAKEQDVVFIGGSTFVVAEALELFKP